MMASSDGKKERFLIALRPVHDRLEAFALAMTRDRDEAGDVVNETLLRAYERFDQLRDEHAFGSYLMTIASNTCKRRRWRRRLFTPFTAVHDDTITGSSASPDGRADVEQLYAALARLPEKQREAVVLFDITGLSLKEVQSIQGGTLSGVKSRVIRGREKLAELLGVNKGNESNTTTINSTNDLLFCGEGNSDG